MRMLGVMCLKCSVSFCREQEHRPSHHTWLLTQQHRAVHLHLTDTNSRKQLEKERKKEQIHPELLDLEITAWCVAL